MQIIDSKRDVYDYLVSHYGLDKEIVYDRSKGIPLKDVLDTDILSPKPHTNEFSGETAYICTLVAGKYSGQLILIRNVNKVKDIAEIKIQKFDYSVLTKFEFSYRTMELVVEKTKRLLNSESPIILTIYEPTRLYYEDIDNNMVVYRNPILKGTPFVSIMSTNAIWEGVYNYLVDSKLHKTGSNTYELTGIGDGYYEDDWENNEILNWWLE